MVGPPGPTAPSRRARREPDSVCVVTRSHRDPRLADSTDAGSLAATERGADRGGGRPASRRPSRRGGRRGRVPARDRHHDLRRDLHGSLRPRCLRRGRTPHLTGALAWVLRSARARRACDGRRHLLVRRGLGGCPRRDKGPPRSPLSPPCSPCRCSPTSSSVPTDADTSRRRGASSSATRAWAPWGSPGWRRMCPGQIPTAWPCVIRGGPFGERGGGLFAAAWQFLRRRSALPGDLGRRYAACRHARRAGGPC